MAVVTAAQKAPIDVVLHDEAFGPFRVLSLGFKLCEAT